MKRVRRAALALALIAGVTVGISPTADAAPLGQKTLRHSFSLTPGLPGNGGRPTSCYNHGNQYTCRIVHGYEGTETITFVQPKRSTDRSTYNGSSYGYGFVDQYGQVFEGCDISGSYWYCDYQVREHVLRDHYVNNGYYLKVLKQWSSYVSKQGSCAWEILNAWKGNTTSQKLGEKCFSGPM